MPVRHRLLRGNAWVASTPECRLLQVLRQAISACAAAAVAASRDGHAHTCVIGAETGQQDRGPKR